MNKLLLGLVALFMSANLYASNLIVNGGFEAPPVNENTWMTYYGQNGVDSNGDPIRDCTNAPPPLATCDDGTLVPGWYAWWTDSIFDDAGPLPGRIEIQNGNVGGIAPFDGNQKVELDTHHRVDGTSNNIVLFQFVNVCPNRAYTLDYAWKSRTTTFGDNDINVIVDDVIQSSSVPTHGLTLGVDWETDTVPFVASDYLIPVAFFSTGMDNTLGMFLDAISLTADDPEEGPCSACIFGKPQSLTMEYTGTVGSANSQPDAYVFPEDNVVFPDPAIIAVYDDNGNNKRDLLGLGEVKLGETFYWNTSKTLKNGKVKDGKVPPKTTFVIIDPVTEEVVQVIHFHTSCSQPLFVDDKFGGLTVWSVNN